MYCLRLFYCYFTRTILFTTVFTVMIAVCLLCIPCFVLIGCCVSELHGHLCPYRNLRLFIVVLQELHCSPNCLHVFMIRLISGYDVSLL